MEVKKYSKLKIIEVLHERGYYFTLRDFLQNSAGGVYWDEFLAASYISSDHPAFNQMLAKVQEILGISGDLLMELLARCETED